jgi:hypothetical protein
MINPISKPSLTARFIIIRLPGASSTKSGKMIDGSSVRQKRVGEKRPSFEELHDRFYRDRTLS